MPSLLETCQRLFGSKRLYDVLNVAENAQGKEIKRAYYKLSLRVHPDRVETAEKADATEKFQTLSKIYEILADKDKRAVYDETGDVDEEDVGGDDGRNWDQYWRTIFKKITKDQIETFASKYKGGDEERNDLKSAYVKHKGDMDRILECVLCSRYEDEPRFKIILDQLIKDGEVEPYKAYTNEPKAKATKRKRKYEREAKEAAQVQVEMDAAEDSLKSAILARQKNFYGGFCDHLAEKYGGKKESRKKKK